MNYYNREHLKTLRDEPFFYLVNTYKDDGVL